jgi:RHS repeat-associated protein
MSHTPQNSSQNSVLLYERTSTVFGGEKFRYGFNGMQKDDEIKNIEGSSYDFGARMLDPRIGRFLSLDPKTTSYPFMSPYCYAANSPIFFIDENGEGPNPPKNLFVTSIVRGYGLMILEAIQKSNNTSLRDLENWSLGIPTLSKSTANKIIGAVGEAIVATNLSNSIDAANLIYKSISFQERNSKNDKSTPDVVVKVTVTETAWSTGGWVAWRDNSYTHPFHDENGNSYLETYEEDIWPKQPNKIYIDNETYEFQYEVKTLNPKNVNNNIKALYNGIYQVNSRIDNSNAENPVGVLVTDKSAYMNIVQSANDGNKKAKKFIANVEKHIENGGRLFLVADLYGQSTRTTHSIRDNIRKRDKKEKTQANDRYKGGRAKF